VDQRLIFLDCGPSPPREPLFGFDKISIATLCGGEKSGAHPSKARALAGIRLSRTNSGLSDHLLESSYLIWAKSHGQITYNLATSDVACLRS